MRNLTIAISLAIALLSAIVPASAIVNGELDNGQHPNVGSSFYVKYSPSAPNGLLKGRGCSGTLISPTVFLTAGHCALGSLPIQANGFETWATFSPSLMDAMSACYADGSGVVSCPGSIKVANIIPNPDLTLRGMGLSGLAGDMDLGLFILSQPVTDLSPATLTPEGYLGALSAHGGLHDAAFTVVGYGITATFMEGQPTYQNNFDRRVGISGFLALSRGNLVLSQNVALDNGGACVWDSGAPVFLGETLVGVVSLSDAAPCRAIGVHVRLDVAMARSFLGQYVTLP